MVKKVTDQQLEEKLEKARSVLQALEDEKTERTKAQRMKLAEHLFQKYGVTTIQEVELLLHHKSEV